LRAESVQNRPVNVLRGLRREIGEAAAEGIVRRELVRIPGLSTTPDAIAKFPTSDDCEVVLGISTEGRASNQRFFFSFTSTEGRASNQKFFFSISTEGRASNQKFFFSSTEAAQRDGPAIRDSSFHLPRTPVEIPHETRAMAC
jgi:hypothetical protein